MQLLCYFSSLVYYQLIWMLASLGSFLSFLEDSLANYYENVDTHLSTALVNIFFHVWTAASNG